MGRRKQNERGEHFVIENIRKIMKDKNLTQRAVGELANIHETQMSKIFNGKGQVSIWQLEDIASKLNMSVVDLLTYPKKFVDEEMAESKYDRVSVTFEVSADKREHLLKIVTEEVENKNKNKNKNKKEKNG